MNCVWEILEHDYIIYWGLEIEWTQDGNLWWRCMEYANENEYKQNDALIVQWWWVVSITWNHLLLPASIFKTI